jgi:hypothetical protein
MSNITEILNQVEYSSKLERIIDRTHEFLKDPRKETRLARAGKQPDPRLLGQFQMFDDYAPIETSDDFRALQYQFKRNMSVASVIATGQEIPSTRVGELFRIEEGALKLGLAHVFDEETEIRMYELRNSTAIPESFINMLFDSINDLQFKIVKMCNVLMAQAWYLGRIQYLDSRSNTQITLSYDTIPSLFPPPLIGNDDWTNLQTATGIRDLQRHSEFFYNVNGYYPSCVKMSQRMANNLMEQEATANFAASMNMISAIPQPGQQRYVDLKIVNEMALRMNFPPIQINDARYSVEVSPGETRDVRYIPDNYYIFCSPYMSARKWGPTLESLQGTMGQSMGSRRRMAKPRPGIFVRVAEAVKTSPPVDRSYAVARFIPWVNDTRQLAARKVSADF